MRAGKVTLREPQLIDISIHLIYEKVRKGLNPNIVLGTFLKRFLQSTVSFVSLTLSVGSELNMGLPSSNSLNDLFSGYFSKS